MLPDSDIAIRLVVAAVLSGLVGLERERGERAAGLRTHALVGLGACLVMIVSAFGFEDWHFAPGDLDPSRIAAQVVSGIGFLGAGVIIFERDRAVVRGLTTAASVWLVAGIGLAVGGGLYLTAALATVLALVILAGLKPLEQRVVRRRPPVARLALELEAHVLPIDEILARLRGAGLEVQRVSLRPSKRPERQELELVYTGQPNAETLLGLVEQLRQIPGVRRLTSVIAIPNSAAGLDAEEVE